MLNLEVKEWREFIVGETFEVLNSKPYHKKDLKISDNFKNSIPYISRTNKNNGVEEIIQNEKKKYAIQLSQAVSNFGWRP